MNERKMSEHTPEPWDWYEAQPPLQDSADGIDRSYHPAGVTAGEFNDDGTTEEGQVICRMSDSAWSNQNANAARIVACVNALAGIEDPEIWVATAKKLMRSHGFASNTP